MALSGSALASAMKSGIPTSTYAQAAQGNDAAINAIANAIVNHIKANAQVVVTGGGSYAGGIFKVS